MTAIEVRGVAKQYRVHHAHRPRTLHEALSHGFRRLAPTDTFWALRGVTLEVPVGWSIGLIGANGAGKSTLLRLMAKVGRPDVGTINIHGRMAALLDLGAGFHDDLTGRENVMVAGVISGLTRPEVRQRFDEIVEFSELSEFIDNPVRTYSTGMRLRLAFSVATTIEPEILVVDEVLAVGDRRFQQKCVDRISGLRQRGCSLVLCSHDLNLVGTLADSIAWLERGLVRRLGPAGEIVDEYSRAADQPS